MDKAEVFANKKYGGGGKKAKLNKAIFTLWLNTEMNKTEIAGQLHISRQTVHNHINKYGHMGK
jgi:DNA invertase Pin-like site-specific DNA recombinase